MTEAEEDEQWRLRFRRKLGIDVIEERITRLEARRSDTIWHRIDAWVENAPASKLAFYSAIVGIGLVVAGAAVTALLLRWHP